MYILILLFSLVCVIPFWIVLADSFASEASYLKYGYQLIPSEWSFDAYQYLLNGGQFLISYKNSLIVTIAGTVMAVIITSMFAYVLANPKAKYRKVLAFLTYFAMVLGGGLVGFYIMVANWLHLKDSLWALILPYLLNPFYAIETPQTATVQIDKTAPTLKVIMDKTDLWSPNHKIITVTASVYADDSFSGIATVALTSITSNEPDNGLGDGDLTNDIQGAEIGTMDTEFMLRAERSGNGSGRIYTITYTAIDQAGNRINAETTVKVPHSQSGK